MRRRVNSRSMASFPQTPNDLAREIAQTCTSYLFNDGEIPRMFFVRHEGGCQPPLTNDRVMQLVQMMTAHNTCCSSSSGRIRPTVYPTLIYCGSSWPVAADFFRCAA